MGFLEQFFKIRKRKNTEHPCTFVQSYMNTIYCLNKLFDYNARLKLTAFFHYPPTFLGQSLWIFNNFTKEGNSNFTHARRLKGLTKRWIMKKKMFTKCSNIKVRTSQAKDRVAHAKRKHMHWILFMQYLRPSIRHLATWRNEGSSGKWTFTGFQSQH